MVFQPCSVQKQHTDNVKELSIYSTKYPRKKSCKYIFLLTLNPASIFPDNVEVYWLGLKIFPDPSELPSKSCYVIFM